MGETKENTSAEIGNPYRISRIKKRDGRVVEFTKEKITNAVFNAAKAVGGHDRRQAEQLADKVATILEFKYDVGETPTVEEVQDVVETVLIKSGHAKTAKAYILYRYHQQKVRETKSVAIDCVNTIGDYLKQADWRVNENSNEAFSFSGLLLYTAGKVIANYALNEIYTPQIADAHKKGYFHIHDLNHGFIGYCAGWSLKNLLLWGFGGVMNKVDAKPSKHLGVVVHQMVNYIGCLQMEFAGAQAFSSVDTLLAPFVKADDLEYKNVKQEMQKLVFSLNIPSRWGSQYPFS
ncbi:ribonucleoside triphosphate reductase, partial [Candidatus Woesearchaeota archaeon]|nr:ribonucleoside triphosphate reductase [Candidatus Woesearchaeota archaeon]